MLINCQEPVSKIKTDEANNERFTVNNDYLLGKEQALKDLSNGVFLFQTSGFAEEVNPCLHCAYKKYNIKLSYNGHIMTVGKENYMKGYNKVAENYFKKRYGNNFSEQIDKIVSNSINWYSEIKSRLSTKYFEIVDENDTMLTLKLN